MSETLADLFANVPDWVDPTRPCTECGADVRVIDAKLEDGSLRPQLVDAAPTKGGWVRVWLNDQTASVRRKVGTVPGNPYLPFKRHNCRRREAS